MGYESFRDGGRRRPKTAPPTYSGDESDDGEGRTSTDQHYMVTRLTRPTTATAHKAWIRSTPRVLFDRDYESRAVIKDPRPYWEQLPPLGPRYYPRCSSPPRRSEQNLITARISGDTESARIKSALGREHRRFVDEWKRRELMADMAYKDKQNQQMRMAQSAGRRR